MVASKYGHDKVVNELAKRGANLNLITVSLMNSQRYMGCIHVHFC